MSSKTIKALFIASGFVLATLSGSANAALINAGFEDGNLNGWTVNGNASVVSSHNGDIDHFAYQPQEGHYFLSLEAGRRNVWQTVSQTFNLNAGDALEGFAAFDFKDLFLTDGARVRILGGNGDELAEPYYQQGSFMTAFGDYPWTNWDWTALSSGTYTLEFAVRNTGLNVLSSYGLFDVSLNAANAPAQVPEPGILALLGLAGLSGAFARRKKLV